MIRLRSVLAFVSGAAAGLLAALMLDPATGRRRRQRLWDRARHGARQASSRVSRRARYQRGHLRGVAHEAAVRAHVAHEGRPADLAETLVDKVRSEAFRGSRQELAQINLTAADGVVHVFGAAHSRAEADDILQRVGGVHGVRSVVDHLRIHEETSPGGGA